MMALPRFSVFMASDGRVSRTVGSGTVEMLMANIRVLDLGFIYI